ncbi:MAG: polysaccharide biosynthesis protein [Clostridiales bacterium]|nr:polysaccharide biosynthesis protein [Clostridiales bacterium]MBQ5966449.1 polysaccharide biosynthesis protein [Clostridiales bacterium]MBQ6270856.1 polysaccharide biosynthesis protein [Clostridiales bacterium]MBR4010587.1 polysaccharide biosynthesis protein [Clostridiales bacterium]
MEKNKTDKVKKSVDLQWVTHSMVVIIADILVVIFSYFAALWLRFDMRFQSIPKEYFQTYLRIIPIWCVITIAVFLIFKLYHSIWSYVSIDETFTMVEAYCVIAICNVLAKYIMKIDMPRSFYFFGIFFAFVLHVFVRFSYRLLRYIRNQFSKSAEYRAGNAENVMIIGGGSAGGVLLRELKNDSHQNQRPVCIIDDNPGKIGRELYGVPIVGGRDVIVEKAAEYNVGSIIFAMPTASPKDRKEILDICKETGAKVRVLPGVYQLANGEVSVNRLKDVELIDLLGRDPIQINNDEVFAMLKGKTILVTGGGGSIGSELCRQIAAHQPKQLIIFDIYENGAYDIQQELVRKYHEKLNLVTLIGSVRNTHRIESVMQKYKPNIVFHAAAHKHVPLMEDSPNEAIKNNVMGTYKTAVAAAHAGVETFVLISTDKAVNPTNLMGASKRICEMVIQMMNRSTPDTNFVAVRFGNVLGSNGSVVPLFRKQIEEGGPVTVTHKDIIRYFMTIPEAVSLVLQASQYAKGGEIFVLDMGDPVKIDDMARNLIKLSGLTPDVDIPIVYTGLRPGEKLYEEKLMDEEGMQTTDNKLIFIGKPIEMDDEWLRKKIEELDQDSQEDDENIKKYVQEIVPTYRPGTK